MNGIGVTGAVGTGISTMTCPTNICCTISTVAPRISTDAVGTDVGRYNCGAFDLEEPPWYPNKRDRCHEWLLRVFRPPALARLDPHTHRQIAEYLAENDP